MQHLKFYLCLFCAFAPIALFASDSHTYLPVQTGAPQGGVIVRYPDSAEPLANQLGNSLSEFGWSVLLVPIVDSVYPPTTRIPSDQLVAFMTNEKGQLNLVLLAIGDTWDASTNLETPTQTDDEFDELNPVQGIVLVDVPGDVQLPPDLPVLDVVTRRTLERHLRKRSKAAKREQANQQPLLLTYSTRAQMKESRLGRRIRGWLDKNVKGQELLDPTQP